MKNNKGFSLVELIIVIAIMAVLIGVLAPQYLKYVEKSRVSTDETAIASVREAMLTSLADEKVYNDLGNSATITIPAAANATLSGSSTLLTAVQKIVGSTIKLASKTYQGGSAITFTATFNTTDMTWQVTPVDTWKKSN